MMQFPEISTLPVSYIKQGSVIFSIKYILAYAIGSPYAFPHVTLFHFSSSSLQHIFFQCFTHIYICTQRERGYSDILRHWGPELLWGGGSRAGNVAGRRWLWQAQGQEQGGFVHYFFLPYFSLLFLAALSHAQHFYQQHPIGEALHLLHRLRITVCHLKNYCCSCF